MLLRLLAASGLVVTLLAACASERQAVREIDCHNVGFTLAGDRKLTHCVQGTTTAPLSDGGPDDTVIISAGDGLDAVAPGLFRIYRIELGRNAILPDVDLKSFLELYVLRAAVDLTSTESLGDIEVGTLKTAFYDSTEPLLCYGFLKRREGDSPAKVTLQLGGILCAASEFPSQEAVEDFLLALQY